MARISTFFVGICAIYSNCVLHVYHLLLFVFHIFWLFIVELSCMENSDPPEYVLIGIACICGIYRTYILVMQCHHRRLCFETIIDIYSVIALIFLIAAVFLRKKQNPQKSP